MFSGPGLEATESLASAGRICINLKLGLDLIANLFFVKFKV